LDGRAQATGLHRRGGDATLLIMFNAYHDLVTFTLPESVGGVAWTRLLDTNLPDSQDVESFKFGTGYDVTGRSLLMFVLKPEDSPGDGDNAMERSYQHVMQAFERANVEHVRFHLDAEG
ncbi:MAG: glycogen debranching enzyme GlgX, partial [Rhodospirillales bacterium]|nr:glycogen debranching enzyme GlgX [Acetobacter sp.]